MREEAYSKELGSFLRGGKKACSDFLDEDLLRAYFLIQVICRSHIK